MKCLKNRAVIISFIILFGIALSGGISYVMNRNKIEKYFTNAKEECLKNSIVNQNCKAILDWESPPVDAFTIFFEIVVDGSLRILCEFGPFFIIIPAVWCIAKEMKNAYLKDYLLRDKYSNYLKHLFKSAYKCIWILPVIMLIVLGMSCILAKGNFDYSYALANSYSTFDEPYLKNFGLFFMSYLLNLLFFSIFYANLGLLYVRKNKSIVVTIIEAYLTFIGIEIINEAVITTCFYKVLHMPIQSLLNIYDIYSYKYVFGILPFLIVGFLYATASTILVYLSYKNKEKIMIDCERIKCI